jgi:hypothetical protein
VFNLCFSACFPDKDSANILADRIAYFGFNAVRLHHMDFYFEPNGIFEDICPTYKNPQMKKTGFLSKRQLDRLDYFIYLLKERGIYIDMNTLVSRHFTEADGVVGAEKLEIAAKPVSMFDQKLIELQKQYDKDLLTHYNPYTKLRYCDDPTIALVEITNENSIIPSWHDNKLNGSVFGLKKDAIPDLYSVQLDKLWNDWLKDKYKTTDNIKKAWMTSSPNTNLSPINFDLTNWIVEQHQGAELTKKTISNSAILTINNITDTAWHLQFRTVVPVKKGRNYSLSFSARANKETKLGVVSQLIESPWTNLGLSETVDLNTEFKHFEIPFTVNNTTDKAKIGFIVGNSKGKIEIKDVNLKETGAIELSEQEKQEDFRFQRPLYKLRSFYPENRVKDMESFYIDLQKKYFDQMLTYLKNEIRVKCPITGIGGMSTSKNEESMANCDFFDLHAYWDHPRFPHNPWDKNDFIIHNRSLLQDPNLGIIGGLKNRINQIPSIFQKPLTITEWNHCFPNQYAYETPILIAFEGANNNWDGLFQFAFINDWELNSTLDKINSYFDSVVNSQKLILCALGSLAFHTVNDIEANVEDGIFKLNSLKIQGASGFIKDKTVLLNSFCINSNQNGTVFIFSAENKPIQEANKLILITISEIKNKNSGWLEEKFTWGTSPTLLKKMNVTIEIPLNKSFKVYELNVDGTRKEGIKTSFKNKTLSFSTNNSNSPLFEIINE